MLKRFIMLMIYLLVFLSFSGCDKDDTVSSQASDKTVTDNTEEVNEEDTNNDAGDEATDEAANTATEEADASAANAVNEEKQDNSEVIAYITPDPTKEYLIKTKFTSELLSTAVDGSNPTKDLIIYLPPSYYASEQRYPVVYFLHGYGELPLYIRMFEKGFNKSMQEAGNHEFIAVGVDGRTLGNGGSFYVNSPVIGPFEDYIIKEIVPYIDENYRTIANVESRGIAGFSMGGFGAVNLSLLHPEVFSSMFALCPGLLKNDELEIAMNSWRTDLGFLKAYGKAFAPNLESDFLGDIPAMDQSEADLAIQDKWLNGFGNLEDKLDAYLAKNQPLKAIYIMYGLNDMYPWIPSGSKYFTELMTEKGIEFSVTETNGGHSIPGTFAEDYIVPFFSKSLSFEE
jgi:enterochelin esterase-like enzyme